MSENMCIQVGYWYSACMREVGLYICTTNHHLQYRTMKKNVMVWTHTCTALFKMWPMSSIQKYEAWSTFKQIVHPLAPSVHMQIYWMCLIIRIVHWRNPGIFYIAPTVALLYHSCCISSVSNSTTMLCWFWLHAAKSMPSDCVVCSLLHDATT